MSVFYFLDILVNFIYLIAYVRVAVYSQLFG